MNSSATPSESRKTLQLTSSMDHRMVAYAACATGLGILVMPQLSEAKIVFTPVHTILGSVPFDVNGDKINDFFFHDSGARVNTGSMRYSQFINVSGALAASQVTCGDH